MEGQIELTADGLWGEVSSRLRGALNETTYRTWFGEADNKQNGVDHSTFTVHLTGSDGSTIKFHDTAHLSTSASGQMVAFDKPVCG